MDFGEPPPDVIARLYNEIKEKKVRSNQENSTNKNDSFRFSNSIGKVLDAKVEQNYRKKMSNILVQRIQMKQRKIRNQKATSNE